MKIIIRNRNKKITTSNITSKEEMVWIAPEQFKDITVDAGVMAAEFMNKHPQIHEIKFSVLPQIDEDEDEDEFCAGEDEDGKGKKRRVVILEEGQLLEDVEGYASQYPDGHWTMEQLRDRLSDDEAPSEGVWVKYPVSKEGSNDSYVFLCVCLAADVAVYKYLGVSGAL